MHLTDVHMLLMQSTQHLDRHFTKIGASTRSAIWP